MNKQKWVSIVLAVVVVGGAALLVIMAPPKKPSAGSQNTNSSNPSQPTVSTSLEYTLAQVAVHAGLSSCWAAVNGGVYDLTTWISKHPGGEVAVLSICGKDGSAVFNAQHGGQVKQEQILATFKIGTLKK